MAQENGRNPVRINFLSGAVMATQDAYHGMHDHRWPIEMFIFESTKVWGERMGLEPDIFQHNGVLVGIMTVSWSSNYTIPKASRQF